jgi:hypothetical protein
MKKGNMIVGIIGAGMLFGLLMFIKNNLGDTASIAFLFYLLGILTAIICMSLGGQLNDQGQRAFIQGLAQLKTVMAPGIREDARTQGYIDRMNIKAAMNAKPVNPDEQEAAAFYSQFNNFQQ